MNEQKHLKPTSGDLSRKYEIHVIFMMLCSHRRKILIFKKLDKSLVQTCHVHICTVISDYESLKNNSPFCHTIIKTITKYVYDIWMLPFNEQIAAEDLDASCNKSSDMLRSR